MKAAAELDATVVHQESILRSVTTQCLAGS